MKAKIFVNVSKEMNLAGISKPVGQVIKEAISCRDTSEKHDHAGGHDYWNDEPRHDHWRDGR